MRIHPEKINSHLESELICCDHLREGCGGGGGGGQKGNQFSKLNYVAHVIWFIFESILLRLIPRLLPDLDGKLDEMVVHTHTLPIQYPFHKLIPISDLQLFNLEY